jgi:twitching motility protein PilT
MSKTKRVDLARLFPEHTGEHAVVMPTPGEKVALRMPTWLTGENGAANEVPRALQPPGVTPPGPPPGMGQAQGQAPPGTVEGVSQLLDKTRAELQAFYNLFREMRAETRAARLPEQIEEVTRRLAEIEGRAATGRPGGAAIGALGVTADTDLHSANAAADVYEDLADNPFLVPREGAFDTSRGVSRVDQFLRLLHDRKASDLHLTVGCAPRLRFDGDIVTLHYCAISDDDFESMMRPLMRPVVWERYKQTGDADFSYSLEGVSRFRVNLFRQHRGAGAVFRAIPENIQTIERLGLPEQLHRLAHVDGGLVLITGPTGSGKSTTLAAIINEINEDRALHIITLEDPIEFVHQNKRCIIHQREIGQHTPEFAHGLRDAIREDPDLLLVGEMRDLETIRLALESAEKGMLVFGTLHTNNAAKSCDRIINSFPLRDQETIRSILADSVRAILAQQLLQRKDRGRVAACELLFGSPALSNLIREGKTYQITNLIQTGRRQGMMTMDDSLKKMVQQGIIAREAAYEKAIDKSLFADAEQTRLEKANLKAAAQKAAL